MPKTIDRAELRSLIANRDDTIVIEALPEKYFRQGHLPGARHLPHDEVENRAAEVAPDRLAPVVVYCASETCQNSHLAAASLEALGYEDVAVYAGGKQDWRDAGLELVSG